MSLSWGEFYDDDKEISVYGSVPQVKMVPKGTRRWIPNRRYGDKYHWQKIYRREPEAVNEQRRIDVRGSGRELYRAIAIIKANHLRPRSDRPFVVLEARDVLEEPYEHLEEGEFHGSHVESPDNRAQ